MPIERFALIGAGGHAAVVYDAARLAWPEAFIEVWDRNAAAAGKQLLDNLVQAPLRDPHLLPDNVHVAIGDNQSRQRECAAAVAAGRRLLSVKHPAAICASSARVGAGSFLAAGAILGPRAVIGEGVLVNHHAVVDHDCEIGHWVHIAPGAKLGGAVRVGVGALVGAGAVILPGRRIGDGAIVGAGAVVAEDVAAETVVAGVPARVLEKS